MDETIEVTFAASPSKELAVAPAAAAESSSLSLKFTASPTKEYVVSAATEPSAAAPHPAGPPPPPVPLAAASPAAPAVEETGRGKRQKKCRTAVVDGETVLLENMYDVTASHYVFSKPDPPKPKKAKPAPSAAPKPAAPRKAPAFETRRMAQNAAMRVEMEGHAARRAAFYASQRDHPEEITAELRDYQLASLDWFADCYERCGALPCILGDEMGLGKTLQTIAYLAWLKFEKKLDGAALVLCPLSVLSTWMAECARWCPGLRVMKLHSSDPGERERLRRKILEGVGTYDVVVTTYEMAKAPSLRSALVQKVTWRCLVLDEGHVVLGQLMLRRLKVDVETGLPPKLETVVQCPLAPQQVFWYRSLLLKENAALRKVEGGGDAAGAPKGTYKSLLNLLMQLRKTCCHPFLFPDAEGDPDETTLEELVAASGKLRVLDRLLLKLHRNGHRVVVFSQFSSMVDILDDYCRLRGWSFCRLTGATNRVRRVVNVRAFNEPSSPLFIFLMTTRAGGLGINLQSADTCVLYDSDWNPQADLQAMARVHRLGQTKTVHIYRLCAAGTAEERVLQRSQKKLYLSHVVNRNGGGEEGDDDMDKLSGGEVLSMVKFGASAIFKAGDNAEPSDADLDAIVDRSRGADDVVGNLVGGAEDNAEAFDATEEAVDTRTLFGSRIDAAPKTSKDIAATWKGLVAEGKRDRKQRVKMVEAAGSGYGSKLVPVLASNDYGLYDGESSVFDRELGGADASAFAVQKRRVLVPGRDYAHETTCRLCPMVVHASCAVYNNLGEDTAMGTWQCPHHACVGCGRSTSAAGGLLFRGVPVTYCEDCLPRACKVVGECRRLVARGCPVQPQACYIRCSDACAAALAGRDGADDAAINSTFDDLDLTDVDAANKKLFESMAHERDAMNAQDISALAAQRREKFQEDLVGMLLDKGSDVDGGGVRVLLKFHGSEYYGAGRQTMTHGFKGAAKALLDLGVARGDTAREVAAELEAAVGRGDLTYVNGSHPVSPTTVVEARYEASPELYAACAEKRAAEDDLRRSAADAVAASIAGDVTKLLLGDEGGDQPLKAAKSRFEASKMCPLGHDCRRKRGAHLCSLFPTAEARDLCVEVAQALVDRGVLEPHADSVGGAEMPWADRGDLASNWAQLRHLGLARTPAVAEILAAREKKRDAAVGEWKAAALRRVDTLGWALVAELFPRERGDAAARELQLAALGALVDEGAFARAHDPAIMAKGDAAYARASYGVPLQAWRKSKPPRRVGNPWVNNLHRPTYDGVDWDRVAQKWRVSDHFGRAGDLYDDLVEAARARDAVVFARGKFYYGMQPLPNFPEPVVHRAVVPSVPNAAGPFVDLAGSPAPAPPSPTSNENPVDLTSP
ncbi:helicase [Aureococcus anophagefferens]|nr:helicase [Aureococcus anophagefferens]